MLIFIILALCIAGSYSGETNSFSFDIDKNSYEFNGESISFDELVSVVQYSDESYILVTDLDPYGFQKFAKYTKTGEFVWGKAFGGISTPTDERDYVRIQTCAEGDSNSIICGGSKYIVGGNQLPFAMKVSEDGEIVWSKHFTGSSEAGSISSLNKVTGGLFFQGQSRGFNASSMSTGSYYYARIFGKLSNAGEIEWIKSYGREQPTGDYMYRVKENEAGNFVFIGKERFYPDPEETGSYDYAERILIGEIDSNNGDLIFFKSRGRNRTDVVSNSKRTEPGKDFFNPWNFFEVSDGYVIVAYASFEEKVTRPEIEDYRRITYEDDLSDRQPYFFQKWSKTGEFMWSKSFLIWPTFLEDYYSQETSLESVEMVSDGFLLLGEIDQFCLDEDGDEDDCSVGIVTKTDFDGNHINTKLLSSEYESYFGEVLFKSSDGGFITSIYAEDMYGEVNNTIVKTFEDFTMCDDRYTLKDFEYNLNDTTALMNEGTFTMDIKPLTTIDGGYAEWLLTTDVTVEFNYTYTGNGDTVICGEKGTSNDDGDGGSSTLSPETIAGIAVGVTVGVILLIVLIIIIVVVIVLICIFLAGAKKKNTIHDEKDTELKEETK